MNAIIVIALATTYATSAITEQTISRPARDWLVTHTLNKGRLFDWVRELLLCRVCMSFWVAGVLTAIHDIGPGPGDFLIRTLAAAGGAFVWIEFTKAIHRPAPKPIAPVAPAPTPSLPSNVVEVKEPGRTLTASAKVTEDPTT